MTVKVMAYRYSVSVGKKCEKCGKDDWFAYYGHNRCACGQYLWIEQSANGDGGRHYLYRQGIDLPKDYRGWMEVTR